jgi:hypothetical protein
MKARPALLLACALWAGAFAASEPDAPQTLPIVYTQPGTRFILRLDNRRYEIPNEHKEAVALLLADTNYPKAKLLWEEYKRALADKEKALANIAKAEQQVRRDSQRTERVRSNLTQLRNQLVYLRQSPTVDLQQLIALQNQIQAETNALVQAEAAEDKSQLRLAEVQKSSEASLERADKAREAYLAALTEYEKQLAGLRLLATTNGRTL